MTMESMHASQETISDEVYVSEDIDEEGDPTTCEKAFRNENSFK
jgi:hypothetical protein